MVKKTWYHSWPAGVPKKIRRKHQPLTGRFSKYARLNPGRTAVNYYGREITYGQLEQLANNFCCRLMDLGVRKGDRIGLFMENCPQLVIALLGGWKAGAVIVPSNPMFLGAELVYQLTDAGVETIILQDDLFPVFNSIRKQTPIKNVIITSRKEFLPDKPALPLHHSLTTVTIDAPGTISFTDMLVSGYVSEPNEPGMEDLALLQYTSGTTGLPKGAMITHRNLTCNTAGAVDWLKVQSGDIHLSVLPFFEVSGLVHSMAVPLFTGGTIILLARFDTEAVVKAIEKYRCTHWASIATMIIALVNYPLNDRRNLSSLRCCLSEGSNVPPGVNRLFYKLTGASLVEGYGLSETISQVTFSPPDGPPRPGSVGIPVQETDVLIVDIDDRERELPPGSEGELLVRGPQVMKGYWNRPDETRLAMKNGWLATGDVARLDSDGYVYLVGRIRELIKPSGFMVFPQEVEKFLYEHPAVAEAVVIGVPDPYRVETVKAYIVPRHEYAGKISEEDIVDWSRRKMAAYKYPRLIEFVKELPHNGNGKVNRCYLTEVNNILAVTTARGSNSLIKQLF